MYLDKVSPKFGLFFIFMPKIINFLKEVQAELNKVVWPTRNQTVRYSILVIIVATLVGAALGGLDYILTYITDLILDKIG